MLRKQAGQMIPKQMRYQAALCPDASNYRKRIEFLAGGRKRPEAAEGPEVHKTALCGTETPAKVPQDVPAAFLPAQRDMEAGR